MPFHRNKTTNCFDKTAAEKNGFDVPLNWCSTPQQFKCPTVGVYRPQKKWRLRQIERFFLSKIFAQSCQRTSLKCKNGGKCRRRRRFLPFVAQRFVAGEIGGISPLQRRCPPVGLLWSTSTATTSSQPSCFIRSHCMKSRSNCLALPEASLCCRHRWAFSFFRRSERRGDTTPQIAVYSHPKTKHIPTLSRPHDRLTSHCTPEACRAKLLPNKSLT